MSRPFSRQQHKNSKRKIITRISVIDAQNKPKEFIKAVGRNSDDQGRIYLPATWIGKTVKVDLVE